jgi:predicted phosphohydrolase
MKKEHRINHRGCMSRRQFVKSVLAAAVTPALWSLSCAGNRTRPEHRAPLRFGIVTDCHYADIDPASGRFYRQSIDKLATCVTEMNAQHVDFLIELGDLKDQDRQPVEQKSLGYLERIEAVFQKFSGPKYHALGNHDVDSLSKAQVLARIRNTGVEPNRAYYSFDVKGVHLIVLDANYKSDGADYDHGNFTWSDANIPAAELEWLKQDLAAAKGPTVVFVHQLLDGTRQETIKNAAQVRPVLEGSGKVLASFQGHLHSGAYSQIAGIHYYTLPAVVEGDGPKNNSYAIVEVHPDDTLTVTGYCKALTRELGRAPSLPAQAQ